MISSISPIRPVDTVISPPGMEKPAGSPAFGEVLSSAIDKVEGSRKTATDSVHQFLSGDSEDIHTVGLATQRADLEMELFLQVRNKVVQAYQEVMRMQL